MGEVLWLKSEGPAVFIATGDGPEEGADYVVALLDASLRLLERGGRLGPGRAAILAFAPREGEATDIAWTAGLDLERSEALLGEALKAPELLLRFRVEPPKRGRPAPEIL